MKDESEFKTFYETELKPSLDNVDTIRIMTLGTALLMPISFIVFILFFTEVPYCFIYVWIFIIFFGVISGWAYITFERRFRSDVISLLVKFTGKDLEHFPERTISASNINKSPFFGIIQKVLGHDLVRGKKGSINFEFSWVDDMLYPDIIEDNNFLGKRLSPPKCFCFSADFGKKIKGTTYIFPDIAEKTFGHTGKVMQQAQKGYGELINLEDPEFEKNFVVYGDDQIEARYIITPLVMQKLVKWYGEIKKLGLRNLKIAFSESKVFTCLIFNNTNLISPQILQKSSYEDLLKISNFLHLMYELPAVFQNCNQTSNGEMDEE